MTVRYSFHVRLFRPLSGAGLSRRFRMTTPTLLDPRQASQIHLEIVEDVIETIQDTFPAAATLDCHRQMRDILTRIKNTLDHPILSGAHIIVYLVRAVRFSRRWATLVKNTATLDPLVLKRHSSALSSPSSVLSPQHSALSSQSSIRNPQSAIRNRQYSVLSTQHFLLPPQHSALSTQHFPLTPLSHPPPT